MGKDIYDLKEEKFKEITETMLELYSRKNRDYGSSVTDTYQKFGLTSFLVRLSDKLNRLINLNNKKEILVKDEKIEDTLMDMANYCIIALIEMQQNKED